MKRICHHLFTMALVLLCSLVYAKSGSLFNISESGASVSADVVLCLNSKGPLSCQNHHASARNLTIKTTTKHHYPNAGIKVTTTGYQATGCTHNVNGYCLFAVNGQSSTVIHLKENNSTLNTLGGAISGLVGSVTLKNNGGDTLTQNSDGSFAFATAVAQGSPYNVTVSSQPSTQTCTVSNGTGTMGSSAVTNVQVTCSTNTYTVGGTITGLSGSVTLQNNGGDALTQNSDGSFTFTTAVAEGSTYSVTISSQPATQTCTVSNGTGTMGSSAVTNVQVDCTTNTHTLSGTISGLIGSVSLKNNGGDTFTQSTDGSFTFATAVAQGTSYNVTISSQPATQTCMVSNGTGTMGSSAVTNVQVDCTTNTHTLSGTISGLSGSVTLKNNGGDALTQNADGSFTFATAVAQGTSYNVTISSQPATETCTVSNGTGTMGSSAVTNVQVDCTTNTHTLSGTISGLIGSVSLKNNGGDTFTQNTDGSFTFATVVAQGTSYNVTVSSQPATQTCTVSNGTGTMGSSAVTNVQVTCSTNTYTVGGTITGLSGSVTLKNNGSNALTKNSGGSFTFTTAVAEGSTYSVTISSQPATQTCTVSNGTGTMGSSAVTTVQVTCSTNTYTLGGTISGLSGSVSLQNNSGDTLTRSANGSFTFATVVAAGSTYNVTVSSQPGLQTCTVSNGTGTMGSSNVTDILVSCANNTTTLSVNATGTIPVGSGSGSITITNTGTTFTAYNVSVTLPSGWTGVTQDASNCTSIAPNNGTCTITFTTTKPYVAQGNIPVIGDNISNAPKLALAFTVQGFLVWEITDMTTVQVIDTATFSQKWGYYLLTNAGSFTNGFSNTAMIKNNGISPTAGLDCYNRTSGGASVGTWYLPAICQMGGSGLGAGCATGLANINTNLALLGFGGLSGTYWSSTEGPSGPAGLAYWQVFGSGSAQNINGKSVSYNVRCARALNF